MTTIVEIARAVGVSPSTVSRVLNGNVRCCSEATRRRITEAATMLDYRPSAPARALVGGRTHTVAVASERPDDPHPARMLAAVYECAREHGYHSILCPVFTDEELLQLMDERRADILLNAQFPTGYWLAERLSARRQLMVSAGPRVSDEVPPGIVAACWDEREGLGSLLDHLVALGHRRIAYLNGAADGVKRRIVLDHASALGIHVEVLVTPGESDGFAAGALQAREALARYSDCTALVGRTDELAAGALHAVQEAGLRVPEDISVAGYYDYPVSSYLSPSLTSVYTPFTECAVAVLHEALSAMEREPFESPTPRLIMFPTRLEARGSTGPPSG